MLLYQKQAQKFAATRQVSLLLKEPPQYGLNAIGIDRLSDSEPRYIRITDIDEFGRLKSTIGKTADDDSRHLYMLGHDDILLARSGTVGKCYIHKAHSLLYPCFYAGYMIKFVVDKEKINPDYFFYYTQLKPFADWVSAVQRVAAQPNINAQEYKSLEIPVPPFANQSKIIEAMDNAYKNMADKEKEAEAILGGIDDYLSKELGITWDKKENTLGNRVFTRHRRDINSQRLDPRFYKSAYINLVNVLDKRGDVATIGELSSSFNSGSTPRAKGSAYTDKADRGVYFIRITDIENGKINYSGALKIKREIHKGLLVRSQLAQGDILLSMAGTIGLSVVVLENTEANINQALAKITLKSGDFEDAQYVSEMLNSKIGRMQVEQYSRPALQANINLSEIAKIKIPMLPKQIRRKIMKEISQMRQHAEKLKEQARSELEDAKRYVEKIILGDGE